VPDWDNTESRESDEDAAWRDLVARFEAPAIAGQPVPWPDREDMGPARGTRDVEGAEGVHEAKGVHAAEGKHRVDAAEADVAEGKHRVDAAAADAAEGKHRVDAAEADAAEGKHRVDEASVANGADGLAGANGADGPSEVNGAHGVQQGTRPGSAGKHTADEAAGPRGDSGGITDPDAAADEAWGMQAGEGIWVHEPNAIWAPERAWRGSARGMPPDDPDDEHFVPPTPPPLPKLDPITKGAWAALFGGPGYLVLATAAGWSIPGLAAFCAVAAFVAGFAILVLRMHEPESERPDDNDDGAVV
jgi:hypothetical protein